MKRPFAVIGLSLMFSLILASLMTETAAVCTGAGLFLLAAACLFLRKVPKSVPVSLLVSVAGIFLYCCLIRVVYLPLSVYAGQSCEITGAVTKTEETVYGTHRVYMDVTEANGEEVSFTVRLTTDRCDLSVYDRVSVTAVLKEPSNVAGSTFNNVNYLHAKGVAFTSYVEGDTILLVGQEDPPWYAVFTRLRHTFLGALDHILGDKAGIAQAIMLGEKMGLSEEEANAFSLIGVSHLFAVSGLHLSVLLTAFLWLAKRLVPYRIPVLVSGICLVFFFMALTGFSVSVMRAGVMAVLMLMAELLFREADPLNSLGVAVVLLLAIDPMNALDVGFQMSVLATLGLVTVGRRMSDYVFSVGRKRAEVTVPEESTASSAEEKVDEEEEEERTSFILLNFVKGLAGRVVRFVLGSLITTLSANLFLLPVYARYFGSMSLLMPLANFLLIPLGSGILILSMIAALLYLIPGVGPVIAFLPGKLDSWLITATEWIRDMLAGVSHQSIGLSGPLQQLTIVFLLLIVLLWLHGKKSGLKGGIAVLCCTAVLAVSLTIQRVYFYPRTYLHFWGSRSAVCMTVNQGGTTTPLTVEGYYAEGLAEQFGCADGCLTFGESRPATIGGWTCEWLENADGRLSAVVLDSGKGKILLVDRPDKAASAAISARNEYYGLICFYAGKGCSTDFLTKGKAGEKVYLALSYGAVPETAEKLRLLGYDVTDLTDTEGVTVTLTPEGQCSVKGAKGE